MTIIKIITASFFLVFNSIAYAELVTLSENTMSDISGQGGVYLSGEFSINKNGGPLWTTTPDDVLDADAPLEAFDDFGVRKEFRNCGTDITPRECGLRLAVKLNGNSEGWYVLDDLSGGMSFEGLTLRTVNIKSAVDYDVWDDNTNDFQIVALDEEVLQIGLPGKVTFNDFKFKYAVANNGEFGVPLADGTAFKQTEIFGVELNGAITLQGNLLLFPVD
jgi:hypothetical protein